MIIAGDVNIHPQEVENLLITHPKVADVAVFGVLNADLGSQHLARFKCPRSIDFEAELPRHPMGKLYKRLLKER